MASIHKQTGRPNWFCAFYDPEGFRRFRSTGTENAKIARTVCVNVERAASLTRQGKLSNEKALKLVRETCDAIAETHGKLAATRAETVLKPAVEEFIRTAGGEFTSYTMRGWLDAWIAGRTDASKTTVIEYRRIIEMFLKFLGERSDRALTKMQPRQVEDFKTHLANPRQNSATDILQLFGYGLVTMVAHRRNKSTCRKSKWEAMGVASGCA